MDNLNLNKLKLKGKCKCDCGYEFTAKNITNLIRNDDVHYYGGRVKFYSDNVICPTCHKKVIMMLENYNNSFRVIDIADMPQKQDKKKEKDNEENVSINTENENAVICEKCGRTFKSAAGLVSHQKKCLGNN